MSLDTIDKITRNAGEVLELLRDVQMPFETAVEVNSKLRGIEKFVEDIKAEAQS